MKKRAYTCNYGKTNVYGVNFKLLSFYKIDFDLRFIHYKKQKYDYNKKHKYKIKFLKKSKTTNILVLYKSGSESSNLF